MAPPPVAPLRLGAAVLAATALVAAFAVPASAAAPARAPLTASAPAAHQQPLVAQQPYLGWSSWSLESTNYPGVNPTGPASWLTEAHVLQQTDVVAAKLKPHGYQYVNIDAGWQSGFDSYGRPKANAATFPDGIAHVADYVHGKGLKLGIYLAVGLDPKAYGTGDTPIYGASGCTTKDLVYPDLRTTNGWNSAYKIDFSSSCAQSYVDSIADEFAGWGVDFLKLDGVGPGSFQGGANYDNTADVEAWSAALKRTGRPIQFTVSWALSHDQADVWKANSNGWRVDTDVECYCGTLVTWNNSVKQRWNDVVQWIPDAGPGHWNNLDSLDVGNAAMDGLTDAERQSYTTLWAIEAAPLYSGDDLTKLDSYGLSLLTNDEVLAVDQAGTPATPVSQSSDQQTWYTRNADGSVTVALFNLGSDPAAVTANWSDLGLSGSAAVHDLWSHQNLAKASGSFSADLPAHGSRLLRITPSAAKGPGIPVAVHGTASTPSSVSLAWAPSTERGSTVTGYEVYADGRKAATVSGTSATVFGLPYASTHTFTVLAVDRSGRRSATGTPLTLTTKGSGGAVVYEAESPANTLSGGASVADCGNCSGGKKIGNLGGSGTLTFPAVTVAKAGTYLVDIAYVDGDSSRTAVVTVNGTSFKLPLSGSNNNDWGTPQTVTVPVPLKAGANSIQFGNPTDYVSDIDRITL
ncbi:fibronectin type III domain-containing protein [Streptacidiphilus sp. N1-3]|uniref:Alpha-galactosidase n=1 Tax=Streptacidiphilus alkalitolerans TaxID=3342712 RepID=A0ABV6X649_9ACTN